MLSALLQGIELLTAGITELSGRHHMGRKASEFVELGRQIFPVHLAAPAVKYLKHSAGTAAAFSSASLLSA